MFNNDMSSFSSSLKGKWYEDNVNSGTYDTPVYNPDGTCDNMTSDCNVDEYNSRLDANGVSTHIKATASVKPQTKAPVDFTSIVNFNTEAAFQTKVDLSLAGQMRDCAECHVGGGAMEYVPMAPGTDLTNNSLRLDLRTQAPTTGYNAWNYFIDQYDEDGDGILGEVLPQDYAVTGVLEMDCLMCHLEGYSWADRTEALRKGEFDASRAVGAELGVAVDGTHVTYDTMKVVDDGSGNASLAAAVLAEIKAAPPSANCSSCHSDMHQVDWKKRGDSWTGSYTNDVHASIGCMACHERADGVNVGGTATNPAPASWTGAANAALGHDPAKGSAPYTSLWNNNDSVAAKGCAGCHGGTAPNNFGAADPTAKHEALGLTAAVLQSGTGGTMNASHIDVLDCSTCHVRKLGHGPTAAQGGHTHGSLYEWGTGGAMVDGTGADAEGRNTDHENLYIERTMENNLALAWQGGKLIRTNALVTMFWRDKDESFLVGGASGYVDINADGQTGGMDAVNSSHVRDAMQAAGLDVLTHDGQIDATEVGLQRAALKAYLPTVGINLDPDGDGTTNDKLKLSFMGVMFKVNHNVSPAINAWGKGGCTDCHAPGAGFYNGTYQIKPRDLTISYASTDRVPFTKVNMDDYNGDGIYNGPDDATAKGDWQYSDFHPTLFAKTSQGNGRSIALQVSTGTTLRDIDRSEALWESSLRVPITPTTGGAAKASRADYVSYLDSITGSTALHSRHAASGFGNCLNCHDDGAGAVSATFAINDAAGPFAGQFIYTPDPLGNPGTCSANACHGNVGFSTTNTWQLASEVAVTPYLSALHSTEFDNTISLNATRSNCDNGACVCTWDATTIANAVGGDGNCEVIVTTATTYTATVTVADPGGEQRSVSVDVVPQTVEDPQFVAGDVSVVDNGDGTCTVSSSAAGIAKAYIYWGNRKNTAATPAELAAGITAECGSTVRVKLYDANHIVTNLSY